MRRSRNQRRRGRARRDAEAAVAATALTALLRDAYLAGDGAALARLLGPDVHLVVDRGGGGAALPVAAGPACAVALLRCVLGEPSTLRLEARPMNGRSGLVASRGGQVVAVAVPSGTAGAVDHLWVVADPAKLQHWG